MRGASTRPVARLPEVVLRSRARGTRPGLGVPPAARAPADGTAPWQWLDAAAVVMLLSSCPPPSRLQQLTPMKARTLVTDRRYFGVDAVTLRTAAGRVLSRVVGLPPERARVSAQALRNDFGVDTIVAESVVNELVAEGLLLPHRQLRGDYHVHPRFVEFASARVVEPLQRTRAKRLLAKACELAAEFNAESSRNPLTIEALAVFGAYMSRDSKLAELPLGIVVRPRPADHRARWGRMHTNADGASALRHRFAELSSFVRVRIVTDRSALPRPFAVVFSG